jgi:peroxiredoxin
MRTTSTRARQRRSDGNQMSQASTSARRGLLITGAVAAVVIAGLFAIFSSSSTGGSTGSDSAYPYAVGSPGPGETAPPMRLPSTDGGTFDLADLQGQRVMLYFQEGVMCQPCWDQLRDIEARWEEFDRLGIDAVVSITSDPLDVLEDKVDLEGLDTPLLSDPGVEVSRTYEANEYGMMGDSMNGHSFVIVGPDGTIEWRGDYGGAPNYTMYLPVDALLADMVDGLEGSTEAAS